MNEVWVELIVGLVILAAALAAGFAVSQYQCREEWSQSGMRSEYRYGAGCLVERDGAWIPAKAYREVER